MDTLLRDGTITLGIIAVILIILFFMENRRKTAVWYKMGIVLFAMAMAVVFHLTGVSPLSGFHTEIRLREISLFPIIGTVDMIKETLVWAAEENAPAVESVYYLGTNILGNILLFTPLGFFLPLLWNKFKKFSKVILAGVLVSLLIECSQLFLCRGTDIDDLILNTLGTMLGYLFFVIFRKLLPRFSQQFALGDEAKYSLWGFMSYICIFVPYLVTVAFGFYDRALLLAM